VIGFLLGNSRWMLLLSVLAGLGSGLGGAGLIAVINLTLEGKNSPLAEPGGLFAGLCGLLLLARVVSGLLLTRLGQRVVFDLRLKLSRQLLGAPLARLQELGPARILACLTHDVATLAEACQWLPTFCVNAALVAGCLVYLGWLSGPLLVLVAATIVFGIGGFRLIEGRALRGLRRAREYDDALYGHLRSLTQGIKELKLHRSRRDTFLADCLETAATRYRRHYVSGMGFYVLAASWGNALFYGLIGLVLFGLPAWREPAAELLAWLEAALFLEIPDIALTPEIARGYCLTILYMLSPLATLVDGLPIQGRAGIALKKIEALGRTPRESEPKAPAAAAPVAPPVALELNGVTHRYHREDGDRSFSLGPLSLTLNPGELVFLIGGNGSGKTTLSLLLVGLYAPERGDIRLGGARITEGNREYYRQQFSAVFSDFYLFDTLLGFSGETLDAEAQTYLKHLRLDHKVRIENGSFSTLNLSQGQRKRLALLVAFLEDRPFYVFDEWAADQDPVFKQIFYTEILPALKARGKTVVVITHDDGYFHVADRCLKLEEGQLRELPAAAWKRETVPGTVTGNDSNANYVEISV
jgi:putative ATP-binding cassette transporter